MKRSFWSIILVLMVVSSGWGVYVAAQELQSRVAFNSDVQTDGNQRYQFTEHFFIQQGRQFEIFLRIDRVSGETLRYQAGQGNWTSISEPASSAPLEQSDENRYELLSHIYRATNGTDQEQFLRVDYVSGRSWRYQGMAGTWKELAIEVIQPAQPDGQQTAAKSASVDNL